MIKKCDFAAFENARLAKEKRLEAGGLVRANLPPEIAVDTGIKCSIRKPCGGNCGQNTSADPFCSE